MKTEPSPGGSPPLNLEEEEKKMCEIKKVMTTFKGINEACTSAVKVVHGLATTDDKVTKSVVAVTLGKLGVACDSIGGAVQELAKLGEMQVEKVVKIRKAIMEKGSELENKLKAEKKKAQKLEAVIRTQDEELAVCYAVINKFRAQARTLADDAAEKEKEINDLVAVLGSVNGRNESQVLDVLGSAAGGGEEGNNDRGSEAGCRGGGGADGDSEMESPPEAALKAIQLITDEELEEFAEFENLMLG